MRHCISFKHQMGKTNLHVYTQIRELVYIRRHRHRGIYVVETILRYINVTHIELNNGEF